MVCMFDLLCSLTFLQAWERVGTLSIDYVYPEIFTCMLPMGIKCDCIVTFASEIISLL